MFDTKITHDIINFARDYILYTTVVLSLHDIFNVYDIFFLTPYCTSNNTIHLTPVCCFLKKNYDRL